jgi:Tol biopolymer transport system component
MDFGLAKLRETSGVSRLTKAGTTMGTMGYMSPEQVQGLDVDHRTDIFSLGVVLYEMLAGESPFKGVHETAIMYEIVNVDPSPISTIKEGIDPELDRIILECLEKDKDERCQSAKEIAKNLRKVKKSTGHTKSRIYNVDTAAVKTETIQPQVSKTSGAFSVELLNHRFDLTKLLNLKYVPWIISAIFLAAFILSLLNKSKEPGNEFVKFKQLTEQSGEELFPDFSHDGNYIIYSKSFNGVMHIFLQRVGGSKAIDLTADSKYDNYQASYSPNGDMIAFRSERDGGGIFVMGSTGESVHRLTDFGYNPVWSPQGKEVLFATESILDPYSRGSISQLWTVDVGSGKTRKIYDGDAVQPSWSPNGKWIVYWGLPRGTGKRIVYIIPATGGKPIEITSGSYIDWCPTWSPDDKDLYFSSSRGGSMNLWRVRIDKNSGKRISGFEPVTTPSPFCEMARFSDDGERIVYVSAETRDNIYKLNFDPVAEKVVGSPVALTEGTKRFGYLHVSPDNKWIAASSTGQQEAIYIMHTDGSGIVKLTNDNYKNRGPAWSPDGKSLVFYSDRSGKYEIWKIGIDGSNLRQLSTTNRQFVLPMWFPDGHKIVFSSMTAQGYWTGILEIDSTSTDKINFLPTLNEKGVGFFVSSISPNGKSLAGMGEYVVSGGLTGLYIYSLADKSYTKLSNTGTDPLWFNNSKKLLFFDRGKFYVMDIKSGKSRLIYNINGEFTAGDEMFALSPDNKSIYYIKEEKDANIWMGYLK